MTVSLGERASWSCPRFVTRLLVGSAAVLSLACAGSAGCSGNTGGAPVVQDDRDQEPGPVESETASGKTSVDVCGFGDAFELGSVDSDGLRAISVTDSRLYYMGRVDCRAVDGPRLGYPGVNLRIRFDGTELRATFVDSGLGTATTTNYLNVIVDGGEPAVLELTPGTKEYVLASDLAEGEHEILVWKRTEASLGGTPNSGVVQIAGLRMAGERLLQARGSERRLEFIGDSITCGYGSEISTHTPDDFPFTSVNENNYAAYGAVTARLLGAEYMGVSYSGKGMVRNYAGVAGETIPDFYLDVIPDEPSSPRWAPGASVPDAVVINAGTNDFSTEGVDEEAFTERYATFLETLRGYYPEALLVAAIGPMLSDSHPPGANALTAAQDAIKSAISARNRAGDERIRFLAFAQQTAPYGEDWHPTAATHRRMAEQLAEFLRQELNW